MLFANASLAAMGATKIGAIAIVAEIDMTIMKTDIAIGELGIAIILGEEGAIITVKGKAVTGQIIINN